MWDEIADVIDEEIWGRIRDDLGWSIGPELQVWRLAPRGGYIPSLGPECERIERFLADARFFGWQEAINEELDDEGNVINVTLLKPKANINKFATMEEWRQRFMDYGQMTI